MSYLIINEYNNTGMLCALQEQCHWNRDHCDQVHYGSFHLRTLSICLIDLNKKKIVVVFEVCFYNNLRFYKSYRGKVNTENAGSTMPV